MNSIPQSGYVRAEWLVLNGHRVMHPGWLHFTAGVITAVGEGVAPSPALDLGPILMPGCVNAHAHLDLSTLEEGRAKGTSFAAWLLQLLRAKIGKDENYWRAAVRFGVQRLLETGTTAVADIDASYAASELEHAALRVISFREVLGLDAEALSATIERAWRERRPTQPCFETGLSPHAPYSTARTGLAGVSDWLQAGAAVQMHVLETPEERQWCESEDGALSDLLRAIGVPEERVRSWRASPLDVLAEQHCLQGRFSIAHGNELNAAEVERLARAGVGVVFCPGTHLCFGRSRDALALLEEAGVPWGLGTDGWVTGQDLDLRAQARFGAQIHSEFSPRRWFDAATRGGARVLGLAAGELRPDCAADWVVYDDPQGLQSSDELFAAWLGGTLKPQQTWVAGALAWSCAH